MSIPTLVCRATTSSTAAHTRCSIAAASTGIPSSRAHIIAIKSSGRGRLPTCVVRNRPWVAIVGGARKLSRTCCPGRSMWYRRRMTTAQLLARRIATTGAMFAIGLAIVGGLRAAVREPGSAQRPEAPPAVEWPTYDHDLAGTRFSPLTEINAANVAKLERAWAYNLPLPPGGRGGGLGLGGSEAVPLVIAGVMYLPAGNTVVALEADTGKVIWQREIGGGPQPGTVSRRGVGYWPGDGATPPRVIVTAGRRLLSLDAASGKPSEGFGVNGEIDMVVGYAGTPTIYRNVIIVGASVNEIPLGPPGDTRVFDAITGRKLWDFHTVPRPGDVGHDTWLDNGWESRSGTNVWAFSMTVDEARGIVYMPVAGPAANYWGGDRPGANLFADSIVAVDIATGTYRWHFQTVHHDIWDI